MGNIYFMIYPPDQDRYHVYKEYIIIYYIVNIIWMDFKILQKEKNHSNLNSLNSKVNQGGPTYCHVCIPI